MRSTATTQKVICLNVFVWMGLIFLKTHLKDRAHRVFLDQRRGNEKSPMIMIGSGSTTFIASYAASTTIAPSEPEVLGSFLSAPVKSLDPSEEFDFGDLYMAQTMLLRLDDVALFTAFNDSSGAMNYFIQKVRKITGPLSELQISEVMVELAFLNLHLKKPSEISIRHRPHEENLSYCRDQATARLGGSAPRNRRRAAL